MKQFGIDIKLTYKPNAGRPTWASDNLLYVLF